MADKIKGAVYSMLSNLLSQLDRDWGRVLDLYAGTGSIGIEALSRGATWADFVEINAGTCRIISENLEHTRLVERARVNNRSVAGFLNAPPAAGGKKQRAAGGLHRRKGGTRRDPKSFEPAMQPDTTPQVEIELAPEQGYDIIFLDPPYADPKIPDTIEHVARSGLSKAGGLVIIGHSPRVSLAESYSSGEVTLNLVRFRQHGDSAFSIYLNGDPVEYGLNREQVSEEDEVEAVVEEVEEDTDSEIREEHQR